MARRAERQQYYELWATPDVPHRRGDARRWLNEAIVLTMNLRMSQRHPDQRHHMPSESFAMFEAMQRGLRRQDPELHRAVERLNFEASYYDVGATLEGWKRKGAVRSRRISRTFEDMRRSGRIRI